MHSRKIILLIPFLVVVLSLMGFSRFVLVTPPPAAGLPSQLLFQIDCLDCPRSFSIFFPIISSLPERLDNVTYRKKLGI